MRRLVYKKVWRPNRVRGDTVIVNDIEYRFAGFKRLQGELKAYYVSPLYQPEKGDVHWVEVGTFPPK